MLPVIAHNVLQSIELLANGSRVLADKAIKGFKLNEAKIANLVDKNPILAHDGGISLFNGIYYWYGSNYTGNPGGKYGVNAYENNVLVLDPDNEFFRYLNQSGGRQ